MPLLFSYGTLQEESVQRATFGRKVVGLADALPGYRRSRVPIDDHVVATRLGMTHYQNVMVSDDASSRVDGAALEVTELELQQADRYEAEASYRRIVVRLASGREAWVYVDARDRSP